MSDDNSRGVPDKDPDVIDPVGDVADMFENAHVELSEGQDADSPELGDGPGLWKWLEVRDCE